MNSLKACGKPQCAFAEALKSASLRSEEDDRHSREGDGRAA